MLTIIIKYGHLIPFFLLSNYGINLTIKILKEVYHKIMFLFFIAIPFNLSRASWETFVLSLNNSSHKQDL